MWPLTEADTVTSIVSWIRPEMTQASGPGECVG